MRVKETVLGNDPRLMAFFEEAVALEPGKWCTFRASFPGELGRKEMFSVRSWLINERKRRKREGILMVEASMVAPSLEELDALDPLAGVGTSMDMRPDGTWTLTVYRRLKE